MNKLRTYRLWDGRIPRFLFFDKEGRIISLDAKRPSAPDIIEWIESKL